MTAARDMTSSDWGKSEPDSDLSGLSGLRRTELIMKPRCFCRCRPGSLAYNIKTCYCNWYELTSEARKEKQRVRHMTASERNTRD